MIFRQIFDPKLLIFINQRYGAYMIYSSDFYDFRWQFLFIYKNVEYHILYFYMLFQRILTQNLIYLKIGAIILRSFELDSFQH